MWLSTINDSYISGRDHDDGLTGGGRLGFEVDGVQVGAAYDIITHYPTRQRADELTVVAGGPLGLGVSMFGGIIVEGPLGGRQIQDRLHSVLGVEPGRCTYDGGLHASPVVLLTFKAPYDVRPVAGVSLSPGLWIADAGLEADLCTGLRLSAGWVWRSGEALSVTADRAGVSAVGGYVGAAVAAGHFGYSIRAGRDLVLGSVGLIF